MKIGQPQRVGDTKSSPAATRQVDALTLGGEGGFGHRSRQAKEALRGFGCPVLPRTRMPGTLVSGGATAGPLPRPGWLAATTRPDLCELCTTEWNVVAGCLKLEPHGVRWRRTKRQVHRLPSP